MVGVLHCSHVRVVHTEDTVASETSSVNNTRNKKIGSSAHLFRSHDKILLSAQHLLLERLARFVCDKDTADVLAVFATHAMGKFQQKQLLCGHLPQCYNVFSIVFLRALHCRPLSTYLGRGMPVFTDTNVLVLVTRPFEITSTYRCLAPSVMPRIFFNTRCISASSENLYSIMYSHTALDHERN
jgi:hypothetical protein